MSFSLPWLLAQATVFQRSSWDEHAMLSPHGCHPLPGVAFPVEPYLGCCGLI